MLSTDWSRAEALIARFAPDHPHAALAPTLRADIYRQTDRAAALHTARQRVKERAQHRAAHVIPWAAGMGLLDIGLDDLAASAITEGTLNSPPFPLWAARALPLGSVLGQVTASVLTPRLATSGGGWRRVAYTYGTAPLLFAAVVIVGVSDGFFWASLPIVCNSLFGLKNSGGIYGMLNCLGAVGFISLSLGVQPAVYSSNSSVGMMECDAGVLCFRGFPLVCLAYSVGGTCAALGLVRVVAKQRGSLASALLPAQPPRLSGSE